MSILIVGFIAFAVTFIAALLLQTAAMSLGIVDEPDKRKVHKKDIPLLGGLAIYAGFLVGMLFDPQFLSQYTVLFFGGSIIFFLGLVDDIRGLSAKSRLLVQFIASMLVVTHGIRITFLPSGIFGYLGEVFITLFWMVGVTNAFNCIDGLDGLATGSAIINFLFFSLMMLFISGQKNLSYLSFILVASCLGFLPHNFRKAKMFLGDAGSTFLGFMLAGIAVAGDWAGDNIIKVAIPILILGVPIFDMTFTTAMRIKENKIHNLVEWLQYAAKDHFHHYLVYMGLTPNGAVLFIWCVNICLGLSAVMLGNDRAWEGIITVVQASLIFAIISALIVIGRRRKSGWDKE